MKTISLIVQECPYSKHFLKRGRRDSPDTSQIGHSTLLLRTDDLKNAYSHNVRMSKEMAYDIIFQGQHIIYCKIYFLSI